MKCLLEWLEAHPGLASWVQAVGVFVALFLTQYIASREQRQQKQLKESYRNLLREAFTNLREPVVYLDAVSDFSDESRLGSPAETAEKLTSALNQMQEVSKIITEIQDVKRLEEFDAIRAIFGLNNKIDAAKPDFEKEAKWLKAHGTSTDVVNNALKTLGHHASELRESLDNVLGVLEKSKSKRK